MALTPAQRQQKKRMQENIRATLAEQGLHFGAPVIPVLDAQDEIVFVVEWDPDTQKFNKVPVKPR